MKLAGKPTSFDRRGISRRSFLAGGSALAAGAMLGFGRHDRARAQALEGEITIQYELRSGVFEQEVDKAIAAITSQHSGVTINKAQPLAGNYTAGLRLALADQLPFDVFTANSILTGQLAQSGVVAPLSAQLQSWPDWSQFFPVIQQNMLFGNEIWGIPYSVDTHFLFYRIDLFQQAGITVPWEPKTMDDVVDAARKVKQALPQVIPFALFAGANAGNATAVRGFLPLLYAFGGTLKDVEGKWIIDSCAIRQALSFYELLYQTEQLVPQSVMTSIGAANAMRMALGTGQAAMLYDGCWIWDDLSAAHANIGYTQLPGPEGLPFTIGGLGGTWFIHAGSQNPELAWAFVTAMCAKDPLAAINVDDPHIPPRSDSAADPAFQNDPFLKAMVDSIDFAVFSPPEAVFPDLVAIIQNATGIVATGEVSAAEAVERYASELERVLGAENVVRQAC